MKKLNLIACKMVKCYNSSIKGEWKRHIRILYELKFPETLRSHWLANIVIQNILMIKEEGSQHLQRSVRMPSQRQMISKPIRSGILIMRMEISVRYPIRPPKMDSSHYLIFMMKTDGCRRSKENCIPRGRQQRKSSEVIPMMRTEKLKRSRITGIC